MKHIKNSLKFRSANALPFVLGLIFTASILSVYLIEYAVAELRPRASSTFEFSFRTDANSALNAAIAVLEEYYEIDSELYSPAQGWEYPLGENRVQLPDGGEMNVKITDESGKISLSTMQNADFVALFEKMNFSSTTAQEMADCFMDWVDSDDAALLSGAERDDYETHEAFPPNRMILSFDELRYIQKIRDNFFDENGEPNEYYRLFSKIFSLEKFSKVNLNSASPEVLYALMAFENKDYSRDLYNAIRGKTGNVSDGITWIKDLTEPLNRGAREVPSKNVDVKPSLLKIEITVTRGAGEYYLCAYYGVEESSTSDKSSSDKNSASSGNSGGSNAGGNSTQGKGQNLSGSASTSKKPSAGNNNNWKTSSSSSSSSSKPTAKQKGGQRKILKIKERGA